MTIPSLLAAFFLSPTTAGDVKPVVLSGDMREDWTNHAATAEVCAVDAIPTENILNGWHRLGVRMLKRVAYDPEGSAEFFRRRVGFLAIHENADGVWLEDEGKFPESWRKALGEARKDVDVALYCRELAEEALKWKTRDHKVWVEGRRVLWFLDWADFERENLDTLRLEFVCFARRLEQLLGRASRKDLTLDVASPIASDREKVVPPGGGAAERVNVSFDQKGAVELGGGLSFACDKRGFRFTLTSEEGDARQEMPGGRGTLRLYVSDGKGGYLPYEFRLDLTAVPAAGRAPFEGGWFLRERWGKGRARLWGDPTNWRMTPVPHATYGTAYPELKPTFGFQWRKGKPGFAVTLGFSWMALYGHWPAQRTGVIDKWFVAYEGTIPGVAAVARQMNWPRGHEINFKKLAEGLQCADITSRYGGQLEQASGVYRLWYDDRLYGFAKTERPTYQRFDFESDRMFWERVVEPMIRENAKVADITRVTKDKDNHTVPARLEKEDAHVKLSVWKALGKLFNLAERVSVARRDYILMRYAGAEPPAPPPPPKPQGVSALKAPELDTDEDAIQLDDKEF